eukprot:GEMP01030065.1.p1 GENE.GEMP01030065.1~~GEMP01030065.1.p1  ORF type:complete len:541 (+),score=112.24 GEMP01030065.1:50-1624(+)
MRVRTITGVIVARVVGALTTWLLVACVLGGCYPAAPTLSASFKIDVDKPIFTVEDRFLSVTIDSNVLDLPYKDSDQILITDLGSTPTGDVFSRTSAKKFRTLAKGISPSSVRFGGNSHEKLTYNMSDSPDSGQLGRVVWDNILHFAQDVDWTVTWGLNALYNRHNDSTSWDPTNAKELINYTEQRHPNAGITWELGNEPDLFYHTNLTISPLESVANLELLRTIVGKGASIVGPDVANTETRPGPPGREGGLVFFKEFLGNVTDKSLLAASSWHHYYGSATNRTVADCLNATLLDGLLNQLCAMQNYTLPQWLGETSSFFGGGAPGASSSYAAGFMWLDKLGMAARMHIAKVFRQDFVGASYSLIDPKTLTPRPDYWTSVIYIRVVGKKVLDVHNSTFPGRIVRAWAHCAKNRTDAVALIALNTANISATIEIENLNAGDVSSWEEYVFAPYPANNLTSQQTSLNGKLLEIQEDGGEFALPPMAPKVVKSKGPVVISLAAHTYGIFVLDWHVPACSEQPREITS